MYIKAEREISGCTWTRWLRDRKDETSNLDPFSFATAPCFDSNPYSWHIRGARCAQQMKLSAKSIDMAMCAPFSGIDNSR